MSPYKRILLLILPVLLFAGCAPVISKETLKTTEKDVKFADIVKNPDNYKDKTVVLGGTIVSIENQEDKTIIEVLQEPLNYRLKPVSPEETAGRFLVVFPGFKDPAIYTKGRPITVAGRVKGTEQRTLGKMTYNYPVIEPAEHYLWSYPGREAEPSVGIGVGVGIMHSY